MAKLSFDKTYVTVERGDTLSEIARDYKTQSGGKTYQQLAAMNDIENADLIYVGQKIYLTSSSGSKPSSDTKKVTIKQFGLQADIDNVLFITWGWGLSSQTENYQVRWDYYTKNKVWFVGNESTTEHTFSTYSIPSNATQVRVRIKPVSKKKKEGDKEVEYWKADWSAWQKHSVTYTPDAPSTPTVTLDGYKLTAELNNLKDNPELAKFELVKDHVEPGSSKKVAVSASYAAHTFTIAAGSVYKVRACVCIDGVWSSWSDYSSNVDTPPATPSEFKKCEPKAGTDKPTIYLEWASVNTATSYDIEYTTEKTNFDVSDQVTSKTGITTTSYELSSGIENGKEYFFRVRAVNAKGTSGWSKISSTIIGTGPSAPTTWSSTTTVVSGDPLTLYWVHNSEDGSSQTFANLEIYVNDVREINEHIENKRDEEHKDDTSSYQVKMVNDDGSPIYPEGAKIEWRVRTAGITNTYGDWSIVRSIDVYAQPTLDLGVTDISGAAFETLTSLPIKVSAVAGPKTQAPIGYYVTITSDEIYETVDDLGNVKIVGEGEQVYSKHFDISEPLETELSASDLSLENGVSYRLTCTASMNSGLSAEEYVDFTVSWAMTENTPNAEIGIDEETYSAYIKPYCSVFNTSYHKVNRVGNTYVVSENTVDGVYGSPLNNVLTTTGEQVMYGTSSDGETIYYCTVVNETRITDVLLSVYRREYDGSFTELIKDLDGEKDSFITDPHPALDYARYRIVATSKTTGAVTYTDLPGHRVGEKAIIIQWDEEWSVFDTFGSEDALEHPPWSGSLVRLPYNVDVSEKHSMDVIMANYIGRKHPVSYYGTQLGETATWNVEIDKADKETIYALRRLAAWTGNVYVREPSGVGYWANVKVSFSQKHKTVTIPVNIDVTRVEGGV